MLNFRDVIRSLVQAFQLTCHIKAWYTRLCDNLIKTLIFNKGYWDGNSLFKLKKQYGIDFIVPAKANLKVTKRLKKQVQKEGFEKIKPDLEIKHFKQITDAPNYDNLVKSRNSTAK